MKSAFSLFTLLALGVATACSAGADGGAGSDSASSDLGAAASGDDPCSAARILCPTGAHCEAQGGHPSCVADGDAKVGFDVSGKDGGCRRPVGFFPNTDAGSGGGCDGHDAGGGGGDGGGACPPGKHRCCTSSGFQCIAGSAMCTMLDAACQPPPPKVGFFGP